mgnify:CR=1 FL=1
MYFYVQYVIEMYVKDKASSQLTNMFIFDKLLNHFYDIKLYNYIKEIVTHYFWLDWRDTEFFVSSEI